MNNVSNRPFNVASNSPVVVYRSGVESRVRDHNSAPLAHALAARKADGGIAIGPVGWKEQIFNCKSSREMRNRHLIWVILRDPRVTANETAAAAVAPRKIRAPQSPNEI